MFSVAPVFTRCASGLPSSFGGTSGAISSSLPEVLLSGSFVGRFVRLYVGRRLRYLPRSGMKREF